MYEGVELEKMSAENVGFQCKSISCVVPAEDFPTCETLFVLFDMPQQLSGLRLAL